MRPLPLTAFALFGLAAASGCTQGAQAPQAAATQGGETRMWAAPRTLTVSDRNGSPLAERISQAYGPELGAAKVVQKGPALAAGDMAEEHSAWKQAGAKLDTLKASKLDDLPKCQEL